MAGWQHSGLEHRLARPLCVLGKAIAHLGTRPLGKPFILPTLASEVRLNKDTCHSWGQPGLSAISELPAGLSHRVPVFSG